MPAKRDSGLFAPGSIASLGRQSGHTASNGSHESLTAHPLLSPPGGASSASSISSVNSASNDGTTTSPSTPPRYVPYTPRQRAVPAPVTTGTTMQPSIQASSPHSPFQGDATSKLQLMNLKAAAQKGGLDAASTGWAILEKLGTETDHSPEWNEIWSAISVGKACLYLATLLLPLEAHPPNEPITPEFMKDHIVLCDGGNRNNAPIVTLSGLRGTLIEETLTIRSTLHPSSKLFQALLNPATRTSALSSLPPLPEFTPAIPPEEPAVAPTSPSASPVQPKSPANGPTHVYPTYSLPSHNPSLPLPPRPTATSPSKPPLPPRPGIRTSSLNAAVATSHATTSRLSNPFASLFGRAATPPPPTASPTTPPTPLHRDVTSPTGAVEGSPDHVIGVPAFTMTHRIIRKDVAKNLMRTLHAEIRAELGSSPAPSWVAERIEDFATRAGLMPFVKTSSKAQSKLGSESAAANAAGGYVLGTGPSSEYGIEGTGQQMQEFFIDLEEELLRRRWGPRKGFGRGIVHNHQNKAPGQAPHTPSSATESASTSSDEKGDVTDDKEKEKDVEPDTVEDEKEKRVREVMEVVERTLCSLFYDKLFLQPSSDDANHDEALSSRIAAVNMLDLTLDHLGVDVGLSGTEVEAVVQACGETLTQLDSACRAPADKAAVLVAAHKIIVDGLSRLPPIKLKSEEDIAAEKTPRAANFSKRSKEQDEDKDKDKGDRELSPVKTTTLPSTNITDAPTVLSPDTEFASTDTVKALASPEPEPGFTAHDSSGSKKTLTVEVPSRAPSPRLTISPIPPSSPTPVSGDIILPLMIFAVVKANPPHLVSHLLYTQRFRNQAVGGEESYCLINLLAVAEFLENVDLAALGLGESEKTVISAAELTPITARFSEPPSPHNIQSSLRGRVEQQVDAIAGSANKVISGVVDSSFGVLKALLPGNAPGSPGNAENAGDLSSSAPWNARPGFGLLRRDTGFSIATLAASLPASLPGSKPKKDEESGQQLVEVPSRPASSRSIRVEDPTSSEASGSEEEDEDDEDGEEEEEEEVYDTRSIRSFESMMSSRSTKKTRRKKHMAAGPGGVGRKSITDRLASVPGLSRLSQNHESNKVSSYEQQHSTSPPASRRSSLLLPTNQHSSHNRYDTPSSSRVASPVAIRISPPNPRFLECTVDDIKVSEVGELLREYKRLVEAVRAMGGFHDE
ncbi:hypothetical protein K474DRAFT_1604721 [Panus rudis PR-1116 ss-1]|nr:hypothetical protein K474DRAFT_1604721 [Panus rudis PR-1116 ss-1]